MPRQPLIIPWWARILTIVASVVAVIPALSAVAGMERVGMFAQGFLYAWILAVSVGIERFRGGNHVTLGLPLHSLALTDIGKGAMVALAALTGVVTMALTLGATWSGVAFTSGLGIALLSVMLTVIHAAGEELLFRGVIMQAITERFGTVTAVLVTSVPFGLAHAANPDAGTVSVVNTVLAGIALGAMVIANRSLWLAIGFHGVWNLGVAAAIGPLSGYTELPYRIMALDTTSLGTWRWLVDGSYGIEEGLATTLALVIITVIVLRSQRYDAFVEAARLRRSIAERCRPYTAASPSTSTEGSATSSSHDV